MSRDKLLVRRRPGDLETPVSAMLKLGADTPGTFLFESILGGERLGRYSFIGLHPQRWMRVLEGVGEASETLDFATPKARNEVDDTLDAEIVRDAARFLDDGEKMQLGYSVRNTHRTCTLGFSRGLVSSC